MIYAGLIDRLRAAGADCAAITSLGGHFCFDETVARSSLPLVSAVRPLDAFFAAEGIGTVGLLGTRVVMRTRLYGQLRRTRAIALDEEIETLGQLYQEMARMFLPSWSSRALRLDIFWAPDRGVMGGGMATRRDGTGEKKPPGSPAVFWVLRDPFDYAFASPAARRGENQK